MSDLTILCVTNYGAHAAPFLSRLDAIAHDLDAAFVEHDGTDASVIEDVLDVAVASCPDDGWILRLDDDELPNVAMIEWLRDGCYRAAPHWAFTRWHLYPHEKAYIVTPPLYPDLQTRCSIKAYAGGRSEVHQGSPFGTGTIAPAGVAIEHHKFLVRPIEEREALVARYESIRPGAGRDFEAFSLPEKLAELDLQVIA
jgi:hypothetical protein